MYDVLKNVIHSKRYDLADILTKIDTLWVQGSINEKQRLSLISDAQNNAMVENSIDVLKSLYELNKRVSDLEKQIAELKNGSDIPTDEETTTYPPYEVGKWYENGDIVDFDGQIKKCIAPIGAVCVWSPTEYPAYWIDYEDEPLTDEDAPLTE